MFGGIESVSAGLFGAVAFGAGDFAGGRASLRLSGLLTVAIAQLVAAITSLLVLALTLGLLPVELELVLAMLAGAFHVIAVFYLYQGMAHGRVSVIAPVAGVVGIAVPALADILFIEMATITQGLGILLATAAIVLFSASPRDEEDVSRTRLSIQYGLIAGMGYGLADLNLGMMTTTTAVGGLAVARLTGAALVIGLMLSRWMGSFGSVSPRHGTHAVSLGFMPAQRARPRFDESAKRGLLLCALAGFLDFFGQLGYVLSATHGKISVAAALVAMYPAVSVGLAVWLLKERIGRTQLAGLSTSFVSVVLLSQ
jgi:drug/metabolite transporter (DMT)-like permease